MSLCASAPRRARPIIGGAVQYPLGTSGKAGGPDGLGRAGVAHPENHTSFLSLVAVCGEFPPLYPTRFGNAVAVSRAQETRQRNLSSFGRGAQRDAYSLHSILSGPRGCSGGPVSSLDLAGGLARSRPFSRVIPKFPRFAVVHEVEALSVIVQSLASLFASSSCARGNRKCPNLYRRPE